MSTLTKSRDAAAIVTDVRSLADRIERAELDAEEQEALIDRADVLLREAWETRALDRRDKPLAHLIATLQRQNPEHPDEWSGGLAEYLLVRWVPSHYPQFPHYDRWPGFHGSRTAAGRWYAQGLRLALQRCTLALAQTPAGKLALAPDAALQCADFLDAFRCCILERWPEALAASKGPLPAAQAKAASHFAHQLGEASGDCLAALEDVGVETLRAAVVKLFELEPVVQLGGSAAATAHELAAELARDYSVEFWAAGAATTGQPIARATAKGFVEQVRSRPAPDRRTLRARIEREYQLAAGRLVETGDRITIDRRRGIVVFDLRPYPVRAPWALDAFIKLHEARGGFVKPREVFSSQSARWRDLRGALPAELAALVVSGRGPHGGARLLCT